MNKMALISKFIQILLVEMISMDKMSKPQKDWRVTSTI